MFPTFRREGIGLHSGERCAVIVSPGPSGSGVIFDADGIRIPASVTHIDDGAQRTTALTGDGARIGTVEHLLAAATAIGAHDLIVGVEGPDVPALDGSARGWVEALGGTHPGKPTRFVDFTESVVVRRDRSVARLDPLPADGRPAVHVTIEFDIESIGRQEITYRPLEDDFATRFAPARTFAVESEIELLRGAGLATGGSFDNAVVYAADGALNPGGCRFPDEPARHKLLDAVGDLSLLGGVPWATVTLFRPGHRLLHDLLRAAAPHAAVRPAGGDGEDR